MGKIDQLAQLLHRLVELLQECGEITWAEKVLIDAQRVEKRDFFGVEHFLSLFGKDASLFDVLNTNTRSPKQYRKLLSEGYDLAMDLKRNAEFE